MSATSASIYPESTQADQDAQFASVVWVDRQCSAGAMEQYKGMYVAVLGEKILDSDKDANELGRRVERMGDTIPLNRVVLQYIHRSEDWNWK